MVARHFMDEQELLACLQKNPDFSDEEFVPSIIRCKGGTTIRRGANVPEWQKEQEFPICPNPDDPDACNVYKDLGCSRTACISTLRTTTNRRPTTRHPAPAAVMSHAPHRRGHFCG